MASDKVKSLFKSFKGAFEAQKCDLDGCEKMLAELKILIFPSMEATEFAHEARETLELACLLSIRRQDLAAFERNVVQLKMYYNDYQQTSNASEQKYLLLGLYLLHLLASDRIGEFHTELELFSANELENKYLKQPMALERYLMEGNYAKVLEGQKDLPQPYAAFLVERLLETVRQKVGTSLERSYEHLPVQKAVKMLILKDIPALQEFVVKENERKAREELDDPMGDVSPSLARRAPQGLVRWEVKDGRLYFTKTEEKRVEIPALDLMVNTIGYATDLERIV